MGEESGEVEQGGEGAGDAVGWGSLVCWVRGDADGRAEA